MLSSAYNPEKQSILVIATIGKQHFFIIISFMYALLFLYDILCILDNPKTSFCVRHLKDMNKIKTHTLSTDVYGN